jgi:hypothetical protein
VLHAWGAAAYNPETLLHANQNTHTKTGVRMIRFPILTILLGLWATVVVSQPLLDTNFIPSANGIDLVRNTVSLPLHRGTLSDGKLVYFIVTEASTRQAAEAWGVNYAPSLADLKGTSVVQRAAVAGAAPSGAAVKPSQVLQLAATVDFLHGKRSVTPDPVTGFPPTKFSYSAQGNTGE